MDIKEGNLSSREEIDFLSAEIQDMLQKQAVFCSHSRQAKGFLLLDQRILNQRITGTGSAMRLIHHHPPERCVLSSQGGADTQ